MFLAPGDSPPAVVVCLDCGGILLAGREGDHRALHTAIAFLGEFAAQEVPGAGELASVSPISPRNEVR